MKTHAPDPLAPQTGDVGASRARDRRAFRGDSRRAVLVRTGRVRAARAFTLLELLVSLAMMSVLAVSLYSCLVVAFRARDSAEAALEPSRTSELAFESLRNDLESALPPTGILAGAFVGADNGYADDLTFFTNADAPQHVSGTGEIKQVELTLGADGRTGERVLVRRVVGNLLTQAAVDPDEEVVCRGVVGFNLRYFDGTDWQESWDSTQHDNALPLAVEVTVELDRPDAAARGKMLKYVRFFQLSCATVPSQAAPAAGGGAF